MKNDILPIDPVEVGCSHEQHETLAKATIIVLGAFLTFDVILNIVLHQMTGFWQF